MLELRRTVRLVTNPDHTADAGANGFAGTPTPAGLGRFDAFEAVCVGEPDPDTGYLINIKEIDHGVRGAVAPLLAEAFRSDTPADLPTLLRAFASALAGALRVELRGLRWWPTPTYSLEMQMADPDRVLVRQQFDFAAAHRLHVPGLSPDENRALFGKCNRPNGHGHNYRVEPTASVPLGSAFSLADLERLTESEIIDRFDHTHLNEDTEEFGPGGLNPSVEHIAMVCHRRLSAAIGDEFPDVALASVTVWETDRTSCTYPA